jgi:hypothetical protein
MADVDLYRKIVELQAEIVKVSKRNTALENKCRELEETLTNRNEALEINSKPENCEPRERPRPSTGMMVLAKSWWRACVANFFA